MKVMPSCLVLGMDDTLATTNPISNQRSRRLMNTRRGEMIHELTRNRHVLWSRWPVLRARLSGDASPDSDRRHQWLECRDG